jgi:hypothetical protein
MKRKREEVVNGKEEKFDEKAHPPTSTKFFFRFFYPFTLSSLPPSSGNKPSPPSLPLF